MSKQNRRIHEFLLGHLKALEYLAPRVPVELRSQVDDARQQVFEFFGPTCSFCGKHQIEVRKLIAAPGAFVCDECVALCAEILDEEIGPDWLESLKDKSTKANTEKQTTLERSLE